MTAAVGGSAGGAVAGGSRKYWAKSPMTEAARKINLSPSIPFIDLQAQRRRIAPRIDQAIAAVLAHGQFIMGPEIAQLEARLAAHCGDRKSTRLNSSH